MNTTQLLVLLLALVTLLTVLVQKREAFGTSPGTMTQLATSHVTTVGDIPMLQQWLRDQAAGIRQMTESDLRVGFPMEYQILGTRVGAFA